MKRFLAIVLLIGLLVCLTGCDGWDYTRASIYYQFKNYERAYELYDSLGDYADSVPMAIISRKHADYATAQALFEAGEYRQAMEIFYSLDMYMDSPVKAVESQYALGMELLEAKEYGEAVDLLTQLGSYENSHQKANQAILTCLLEALEEPEKAVLLLDTEEPAVLHMIVAEEASVAIVYESAGQLLGVPHIGKFAIFLQPLTQSAEYFASYKSDSSRVILEEAIGIVDLEVYDGQQGLLTTAFAQTITEADGTQTVANDTNQAIILQSLLEEAGAVMRENLPRLLEQMEIPLTPAQLGFTTLN